LGALDGPDTEGGWTGRKLGATAVFGKAANGRKTSRNHLLRDEIGLDGDHDGVALPSPAYGDAPGEERALSRPLPQAGEVQKNPGLAARVSQTCSIRRFDQAAG